MKKTNFVRLIFSIICGSVFTIGFMGCQNEDAITETKSGIERTVSISDRKAILDLGFDTINIVETEEYYIVEEDIILNKKDLRNLSHSDSMTTRQARSTNLVSPANVANIKIKIDASLANTSDWRQAILAAMNYWNDTKSAVYMTEDNISPDIIINANLSENGVCGAGDFPLLNGKPFNLVRINTYYNHLSLSQKILLIAHELGHNLGFRHTNWIERKEGAAPYGAIQIPNTPTNSDSNSVFNAATCGNNWAGFSQYDLIAIRYLYPLPQITSNTGIVCPNENVIYNLKGNIPSGATIVWSTSSTNINLISGQGTTTTTFKTQANTYGYINVKAEITYAGNKFSILNSQVWIGKPREMPDTFPFNPTTGAAREMIMFFPDKDMGGIDANTTYEWVKDSGAGKFLIDEDSYSVTIMPTGAINSFFQFHVNITNSCGTTSRYFSIQVVPLDF